MARGHSGSQLQGPSNPAGQSPLSQDSWFSDPPKPFIQDLGLPCTPTRATNRFPVLPVPRPLPLPSRSWNPVLVLPPTPVDNRHRSFGHLGNGAPGGGVHPALLITAGLPGVSIRSPQGSTRPSAPASFSNRGGTFLPICPSLCPVLSSEQVLPPGPLSTPAGPWRFHGINSFEHLKLRASC